MCTVIVEIVFVSQYGPTEAPPAPTPYANIQRGQRHTIHTIVFFLFFWSSVTYDRRVQRPNCYFFSSYALTLCAIHSLSSRPSLSLFYLSSLSFPVVHRFIVVSSRLSIFPSFLPPPPAFPPLSIYLFRSLTSVTRSSLITIVFYLFFCWLATSLDDGPLFLLCGSVSHPIWSNRHLVEKEKEKQNQNGIPAARRKSRQSWHKGEQKVERNSDFAFI